MTPSGIEATTMADAGSSASASASSEDDFADDELEGDDHEDEEQEDEDGEQHQALRGLNEQRRNEFTERDLAKVCRQFGLSAKHVRKLDRLFNKLDIDKSKTVDRDELFAWLKEPRNMFSDKLFELVDLQKDNHLNFVEFIKALGTFAMFGRDDVLRFCFFTFDSNKNGFIDHAELHLLVDLLHGEGEKRFINVDTVLSRFDRDHDGRINFDEFQEINRKHPMLFYPAFRLQRRIEKRTLGSKFWYAARQSAQEAPPPSAFARWLWLLPTSSFSGSFRSEQGREDANEPSTLWRDSIFSSMKKRLSGGRLMLT